MSKTWLRGCHLGLWICLLVSGPSCSKENNVAIDADPLAQVGQSCVREVDCKGAVCVFGFCRQQCTNDVQCVEAGACLSSKGTSGCRLNAETNCAGIGLPCPDSPALICGLDKTCRVPCAGSCGLDEQECIAGACIGKGETGASSTWFACTTGRFCAGEDERQILSCNETSPGPTVLATCESRGLCEAGKSTGNCGEMVCTPGSTRCQAASVETCAADGTGFQHTIGPCASQQLCEITRGSTGATACQSPACLAGETRCFDGDAQRCRADLTGYESLANCGGESHQCDPGKGGCVHLSIDAHEVTREEYEEFLSSPSKPLSIPACNWNTSYVPDDSCMSDESVCHTDCAHHPQVCVDWCDAWSYCASRGKRLCGDINGGALTFYQFDSPGHSEWMNACSSGGQFPYPYGVAQATASCKGKLFSPNTTIPVGTLTACQSSVAGYQGIYDLSGNVAEWDGSCEKTEATGTAFDLCHVRGGSFLSLNDELACSAERTLVRTQTSPDVGFRCCGP